MEIDVNFERISNGFIITNNDSSHQKTYYASIEKFLESRLMESARDRDTYFKEHDADGDVFQLKVTTVGA